MCFCVYSFNLLKVFTHTHTQTYLPVLTTRMCSWSNLHHLFGKFNWIKENHLYYMLLSFWIFGIYASYILIFSKLTEKKMEDLFERWPWFGNNQFFFVNNIQRHGTLFYRSFHILVLGVCDKCLCKGEKIITSLLIKNNNQDELLGNTWKT